ASSGPVRTRHGRASAGLWRRRRRSEGTLHVPGWVRPASLQFLIVEPFAIEFSRKHDRFHILSSDSLTVFFVNQTCSPNCGSTDWNPDSAVHFRFAIFLIEFRNCGI